MDNKVLLSSYDQNESTNLEKKYKILRFILRKKNTIYTASQKLKYCFPKKKGYKKTYFEGRYSDKKRVNKKNEFAV